MKATKRKRFVDNPKKIKFAFSSLQMGRGRKKKFLNFVTLGDNEDDDNDNNNDDDNDNDKDSNDDNNDKDDSNSDSNDYDNDIYDNDSNENNNDDYSIEKCRRRHLNRNTESRRTCRERVGKS